MQNRIIPSFLAFTALGLNATAPLVAQTRPTPPAASTLPSPSQPGQTTLPSITQPEQTTLPAPTRPVVRPPVTTKPVYPTNPVYPTRPTYPTSNDGFAGRIRCESKNNRLHRCAVSTENRVVLLTRHGGTCEHNRGYGYTTDKTLAAFQAIGLLRAFRTGRSIHQTERHALWNPVQLTALEAALWRWIVCFRVISVLRRRAAGLHVGGASSCALA